MRPFRAVPLALCALALACGPSDPNNPANTTLSIDASSSVVYVGGYGTIKVFGTSGGHPIQDGATISFETSVGSFDQNDPSIQTQDVSVSGQQATVKLFPPPTPPAVCNGRYPCKTTVTAKFIDAYSKLFTKTVDVTFDTKTKPTHINFSCTSRNIGALWDGVGEFTVKCTAVAEDENNEAVPGAHVKFLTEAGEFQPAESGDPGTFIYDPTLGGRLPRDVDPLAGEPSWLDHTKTDGGGSTSPRNPRDGLVTLVAYVEGDPATASTMSTPYVDMNDDDKYENGEDLPPTVTTFEQSQSATSFVWKQIKILWTARTSELSLTNQQGHADGTRVLCDKQDLSRGACAHCTWTVLDKNLNVVAANSEGDAISWTLDNAPEGVTTSPSSLAVVHSMGIDVDDNFSIRNPSSPASYERDANYATTVCNNRPSTDLDGDMVVNVGGSIEHNLATDDSGVATGDSTENLPGVAITMH